MLNIEKYKDEILKKYNDSLKKSDGDRYSTILAYAIFYVFCHDRHRREMENVAEWAFREYEEPILTKKEKAYLKNVIEPLNVVVDYIRKCENYTSEDNIFYTVVVRVKHSEIFDCSYVLIDFVVTEDMPFEGMEIKKRYTSEELGL